MAAIVGDSWAVTRRHAKKRTATTRRVQRAGPALRTRTQAGSCASDLANPAVTTFSRSTAEPAGWGVFPGTESSSALRPRSRAVTETKPRQEHRRFRHRRLH